MTRARENPPSRKPAEHYCLKAVNPNVVVKLDTRTPVEVIQSIEDQGKIVAKSLQTLRSLLQS